jgi:DNA-binding CsgD family transcriptional regulator
MSWKIDLAANDLERDAWRQTFDNRKVAESLVDALPFGACRLFTSLTLHELSLPLWRKLVRENGPKLSDSERVLANAYGCHAAALSGDFTARNEFAASVEREVRNIPRPFQYDSYLRLYCAHIDDPTTSSTIATYLRDDTDLFRSALRMYYDGCAKFNNMNYNGAASCWLQSLNLNGRSLENSSRLRSRSLYALAMLHLRTWPTWPKVITHELPLIVNERHLDNAGAVYKAMAAFDVIRANFELAYTHCKRAELLSHGDDRLVVAILRCWVAHHAGDRKFAAAELNALNARIFAIARDRYMDISPAAEILADERPAIALTLVSLIRDAQRNDVRKLPFIMAPIVSADLDAIEAKAHERLGNKKEALRFAASAIKTGSSVSPWRAAQACLVAFRVSGDEKWLSLSEDLLANYPSEMMAEAIATVRRFYDSPLSLLTERQRRVFDLLRSGKRVIEVARILNLSSNTVRVHVKQIYRAFGVRSQAEFFALLTNGDSENASEHV